MPERGDSQRSSMPERRPLEGHLCQREETLRRSSMPERGDP